MFVRLNGLCQWTDIKFSSSWVGPQATRGYWDTFGSTSHSSLPSSYFHSPGSEPQWFRPDTPSSLTRRASTRHHKPHLTQLVRDFRVPSTGILVQAIKRLLESADCRLVHLSLKSGGLDHVDMFFKIALKKHILYVHLVKMPSPYRNNASTTQTIVIHVTGAKVSL